jgi:hypothetical protein
LPRKKLQIAALATEHARDNAAKLVNDQGRERLTVDILCHDQQRPARLGDLLKQRDQIAERPELVVTK